MKRHLVAASLTLLGMIVIAGSTLAVAPPAPDPIVEQEMAVVEEVWPMPVEDFLAGDYLKRADIVLTSRAWDPASWAIRWATNSKFSHAALVFTTPLLEPGYTDTFVIEAGTSGVDLTNIRDYIADKNSVIAIKRMSSDWFDDVKQSRVRGLLLDEIKAGYNYWAIGQIAQYLWFGVQRSLGGDQAVEALDEKDRDAPRDYICSGLVQIGFVDAVIEYIKSDKLPPKTINQVVFHDVAASRLPSEEDWGYSTPEDAKASILAFRNRYRTTLESLTPEDLVQSEKLDWLYLIKDGMVHKVSTTEEVDKFMPE